MKKRIISAGLVAALALVIFLNFEMTEKIDTVEASEGNTASFNISSSLSGESGIKKKDVYFDLGTEQNPFTVLEIVPNKSMAKIGYLIPGCEPINMEKMEADFASSGSLYGTFEANFMRAGNEIFTSTTTVEKKYVDQLESTDGWNPVTEAYEEDGYFERLEDASGKFNLNANNDGFEYVGTGGSYRWVETGIPSEGTPDFDANQVFLTRRETSYYQRTKYTLINRDWLINDVFEMSSDEFQSQVITVTPDELADASGNITEAAKYWIDTADMIVIGGDKESGIPDLWNAYKKDETAVAGPATVLNNDANAGATECDIPWQAAYEIIKREAGKVVDSNGNNVYPAAMVMDQAAMMPTSSASDNNFQKLFIALVQYDPTAFWNLFGEDIVNGTYKGSASWNQETFLTKYGTGVMANKYLPFSPIVTSYIYAYNGDNIFSHRLRDENAIPITSQGDVSELFDYLNQNSETQVTKASPYKAINYILRQKDYKSKLNILELEACNDFYADDEDWETFLTVTLPWFKGDLEKDVTVTKMATYEFNADISDLNAEYDLIIIGDKQTIANGGNGYVTSGSGDPFWVNNKQIYTNIGGLVIYDTDPTRQITHNARYGENDITEKKKNELLRYMEGGKPVLVLGSLYSNVEMNADGRYTQNTTVNTQKVDPNTDIYELASLNFLGKYENSDHEKLYKFDRDGSIPQLYISTNYSQIRLKRAIGEQSCEIVFNDVDAYPVEYKAIMSSNESDSIITDVEYQPRDASGRSVFTYRFTLEGNSSYTYSVHVFIDHNGDGVYDNSRSDLDKLAFIHGTVGAGEELSNVTVVNSSTGEVVATNELKANTNYTVSCQLPNDFQGILPWKLEVQANENSSVRDSEIKYSAIESRTGNRVKIRVLQMNLTQDMKNNASSAVNLADTSRGTGAKFKKYTDCVKDFDIEIDYQYNTTWYGKYGEGATGTDGRPLTYDQRLSAWKAELDTYDMLVLGFNDMCMFTSNDVFYEGFLYFKNQGKSIILSHDMLAAPDSMRAISDDRHYANSSKGELTHLFSKYADELRTMLGQRKCYRDKDGNWNYEYVVSNGVNVRLLPNESEYEKYTVTRDGTAYKIFYSTVNGMKASEFVDNATYLHNFSDYYTSDHYRRGTDRDVTIRSMATYWNDNYGTEYVAVANHGQITEYPYKINPVIKIKNTHVQYYSLNLEAADDGDVVVWCNLTDTHSSRYTPTSRSSYDDKRYYSSREGDAANNYYIYNKGNVTYTGLGHTSDMTDDEVKLFINTMIAAYRYTASSPAIQVTNEDVVITNSNENVLYVTLDKLNIFSNENDVLPVNFKVLDEADFVKVANRTYTLTFVDENGNALANAPKIYSGGQELVAGEKGYSVEKNGNYSFNVSFKDIRNNGSATYYLKLTSTYRDSKNKEVTTETTRKVSILPLGLFDLD